MRQIIAFIDAIRTRTITEEYYHLAFHAKLHRAEIKPLEEILGVTSEETPFDSKTDEQLEQRALKILEQKRAMRNV